MRSYVRYPRSARPQPLTPRQVAAAYRFPLNFTGKGYKAGVIELGGGYDRNQVSQYFIQNGLPVPNFVDVPVNGGSNSPDGPNGADGEVQLDLIVAAAVAPGATYRVYFAGNSNEDFLAALTQAVSECDGVTISWGSSENNWDPSMMDRFEAVIKGAKDRGVPVFVAAGDTGSQDSSGDGNQADFPASAPSSIGCGGTRLEIDANGQRFSETVWNDEPTQSATGGGVSHHFPNRQVPDIAGNADPDTGYEIMVDGESAVVGGTSAVAPLMLALHALLWEANGGKPFDLMELIEAHPEVCFDVTSGNNGGFSASVGRDDVSGFGVPDGAELLAALSGAPVVIPPPAPVPTPRNCWDKLKQFFAG